MVVTLPDFSLQKPFCRLLVAVGFLGFGGTIASKSNTPPENSESIKKKVFKKRKFFLM